jgi:hypothetical protein
VRDAGDSYRHAREFALLYGGTEELMKKLLKIKDEPERKVPSNPRMRAFMGVASCDTCGVVLDKFNSMVHDDTICVACAEKAAERQGER